MKREKRPEEFYEETALLMQTIIHRVKDLRPLFDDKRDKRYIFLLNRISALLNRMDEELSDDLIDDLSAGMVDEVEIEGR